MKTHLLKAAALVILVAFFANAATLEAEMAYYLESGETYSLENITASGASYALIKISNVPSLVLNSSNEVTSASETINAVAEAYTQAQMDTLRQTTGFRSLQTDFDPVYAEFLICSESSKSVLDPIYIAMYSAMYSGNDPLLTPAYNDALRTTPALQSNFSDLNDSIARAQTLSGRQLYDELGSMVTKVSAINSLITTYASATSYLRTYFADDFSIPAKGIFRYICHLNSTSLNAFSSDLGIRTSIPIASDIAVQITNATNTRTPKANQRKIVAVLAVDYNAEVQRAADAKSRFPLGDSILSQRQNDLATTFQRLNSTNATGTNSTNDLITAFNYSKNQLEQAIVKYEQVYPNYLEANTSVLATEQAMQVARERFGRNDERISSLQTQVNTLSNEFNAAEEALRTATANSSQFQSIQVRALNLTGQITAVQPKESTIDYATIAVIAIIVIGFAALIVYAIKFRKKPPQAASQPTAPSSSGEEPEYR